MRSSASRARALDFAMEGERVRRAATTLERVSKRFVAALRRAVPFLARRGMTVSCTEPKPMAVDQVFADLTGPLHVTSFLVKPVEAKGALVLDEGAISLFIDGILGGEGTAPPKLGKSLTNPQRALIGRLTAGAMRAFSDVFSVELESTLEVREGAEAGPYVDSVPIAFTFEIASGSHGGRIVFLVEKEALLARSEVIETAPLTCDPEVASALRNVELELVAELGRVRMKLHDVVQLGVGDMLNLSARVDGQVRVHTSGNVVFSGHPTTSAGQIAIRVDRHGG